MRFYQSSTVGNLLDNSSVSGSQSTECWSYPIPLLQCGSPLYLSQFNQYCYQFVELSSFLNSQLLRNNELISYRLGLFPQQLQPELNQKQNCKNDSTISDKNATQNEEIKQGVAIDFKQNQSPVVRKNSRRQRISDSQSEESYRPVDQFSKEGGMSNVSESKNIPKNYGKAILNFIRRNEQLAISLLEYLKIDYNEFINSLRRLRGKLNTISELRSLWINSENKFAKAYRILSAEYLRKHSLSYIFNSRVENFHKHIKYRYKIIQSVEHPQTFTCIKQF